MLEATLSVAIQKALLRRGFPFSLDARVPNPIFEADAALLQFGSRRCHTLGVRTDETRTRAEHGLDHFAKRMQPLQEGIKYCTSTGRLFRDRQTSTGKRSTDIVWEAFNHER